MIKICFEHTAANVQEKRKNVILAVLCALDEFRSHITYHRLQCVCNLFEHTVYIHLAHIFSSRVVWNAM